jgi:hypothetical protein
MAFNFPAGPIFGQRFISGEVTYEWDGEKWRIGGYSEPALSEAEIESASWRRRAAKKGASNGAS